MANKELHKNYFGHNCTHLCAQWGHNEVQAYIDSDDPEECKSGLPDINICYHSGNLIKDEEGTCIRALCPLLIKGNVKEGMSTCPYDSAMYYYLGGAILTPPALLSDPDAELDEDGWPVEDKVDTNSPEFLSCISQYLEVWKEEDREAPHWCINMANAYYNIMAQINKQRNKE